MSVLFALAVSAAAAAPLSSCSWDRPGVDRYTGTLQAAVERYRDIPAPVRAVLKERMLAHRYDEIATIRRDRIEGRQRYASELRDMHFGSGRVCASVSRSGWAEAQTERGLVYCESGHCLIVPTVCGNVSRISRVGGAVAGGGGAAGAGDAGSPVVGEGKQVLSAVEGDGDGGGGVQPFDALPGGASSPAVPAFNASAPAADGRSFVAASGGPGLAPSIAPVAFGSGITWVGGGKTTGGGAVPLDAFPTFDGPTPAVPEPETWAMWLGGAALLAWRCRRLQAGRRASVARHPG